MSKLSFHFSEMKAQQESLNNAQDRIAQEHEAYCLSELQITTLSFSMTILLMKLSHCNLKHLLAEGSDCLNEFRLLKRIETCYLITCML